MIALYQLHVSPGLNKEAEIFLMIYYICIYTNMFCKLCVFLHIHFWLWICCRCALDIGHRCKYASNIPITCTWLCMFVCICDKYIRVHGKQEMWMDRSAYMGSYIFLFPRNGCLILRETQICFVVDSYMVTSVNPSGDVTRNWYL